MKVRDSVRGTILQKTRTESEVFHCKSTSSIIEHLDS